MESNMVEEERLYIKLSYIKENSKMDRENQKLNYKFPSKKTDYYTKLNILYNKDLIHLNKF